MSRLVWLIPLFPLVGSLFNGSSGGPSVTRRTGSPVPALFASFVTSCMVFARVWNGETWTGDLFTWVVAGTFKTAVTAQVDQLSAVMLLVVTGVGFLIHLYSIGYMHDDAGYARFFTYLNLFVFSMLMLVLAGNFLSSSSAGKAVGLCSYLLIGFWYEKKAAADAGKKAFIVNRVGDFGFGLGIMLDLGRPSARSTTARSSPRPTASVSTGRLPRDRAPPLHGRVRQVGPAAALTSGCPTRWKARPRSPPSSTPPPW